MLGNGAFLSIAITLRKALITPVLQMNSPLPTSRFLSSVVTLSVFLRSMKPHRHVFEKHPDVIIRGDCIEVSRQLVWDGIEHSD